MIVPKPPSIGTLRKYGLTAADWLSILRRQGGGCGVCGRRPPTVLLCIDHEHVRGWRKLKPQERRRHVRGIACYHCNHRLLGRFITIDGIKLALVYLKAYADRVNVTSNRSVE